MARIDLLGGYKYSPAFSMNNDVDEVNHRLEFPEPLHGPVLDVLRFHLMDKPGILISSFGLLLFIVGWWIMTLALRENAFAAPAVKYQQEREQTVITTGVCSIVRHPVYAGAIPWLIGMAL